MRREEALETHSTAWNSLNEHRKVVGSSPTVAERSDPATSSGSA